MYRKVFLLLVIFTLSFQSLSALLSPDEKHATESHSHAALHFLAEPHTHDAEDPEQIQLEFSAEARHHVACDMNGATAALLQHNILTNSLVQTTPDNSFLQCIPEPYLHRVTPPPRA